MDHQDISLLSPVVTSHIALNLNVPSPSGTLVTAMSLSCQIIEDLITSSDSTTMSLNIIPGMPS